MARNDDYKKAVEIARKDLSRRNPQRVADQSGARFHEDAAGTVTLVLDFLEKSVSIAWPQFHFSEERSGEEIPLQQQVLLLHYLMGAKGPNFRGQWIAYQEVPDGRFYVDAFLRRAKKPMLQVFGDRPDLLVRLALERYHAERFDQGDFSVLIRALPLIPVALILWKGDEEFSPEGNILFDSTIKDILSAEDIAWLAGMIIYPLIGMAGNG